MKRKLKGITSSTRIICKDGVTKEVKDISTADMILDERGRYHQVDRVSKKSNVCHPGYAIKVHGVPETLQIVSDQEVLCRQFKTGEQLWKKARDLTVKDYLGFPISITSNHSKTGFWTIERNNRYCDERLEINYDLGYFIGYFLANGHLRRKEIVFAMDQDDFPEIHKFLKKYQSLCSTKIRAYQSKTSRTKTVTLNSPILSKFLANFFHRQGDKWIPDSVLRKGREFVDGFLKGLFDGDGSYVNLNEVSLSTTRENFAIQLKRIFISFRYGHPSIYEKGEGVLYGRNCKKTWTLKLHGEANWKFREYFGLALPELHSKSSLLRQKMGRSPLVRKAWRRGKLHYWTKITKIEGAALNDDLYELKICGAEGFCTKWGIVRGR